MKNNVLVALDLKLTIFTF